jgi:hypothetical protein
LPEGGRTFRCESLSKDIMQSYILTVAKYDSNLLYFPRISTGLSSSCRDCAN